jgi:hypothetical protein
VQPTISVVPSENKEISRVSRTQQFTLQFLFCFNFNISENVKKMRRQYMELNVQNNNTGRQFKSDAF